MNLTPQMSKESIVKDHWLLPLILVLVSYPTWLVLTSSPILLVVPAALTAFWMVTRQGHYFLAGLLTSVCIFNLEYLPFLLFPGLILGRFYYLAGISVAAMAVFSAFHFMHLPLTFPALLSVSPIAIPANLMQNFAGLLTLILGEGTPQLQVGTLAIYVVTIIAVTELWWRLHHLPQSQNKFLKKCSLTILAMLLASPHTYTQDYIALIPVAIWLWQATANDIANNAQTIRKIIIAFPFLSWVFFLAQSTFVMLRLPPYYLWAVALAVVVLPTLEDQKIKNA